MEWSWRRFVLALAPINRCLSFPLQWPKEGRQAASRQAAARKSEAIKVEGAGIPAVKMEVSSEDAAVKREEDSAPLALEAGTNTGCVHSMCHSAL